MLHYLNLDHNSLIASHFWSTVEKFNLNLVFFRQIFFYRIASGFWGYFLVTF